jgi:hypothetical protein
LRQETGGIDMLHIIGIEQTQAIQYFGSTFPVCANHQPCPDNSIPLVAGKPTVVRVYFDGAAPNVPVTGFGIKLLSDGSPSTVTFPGTADLINVPSPPSPENWFHSLNIEIPPSESYGNWKLMLCIFEKPSAGVSQVTSSQLEMEFIERALVPIRLVRLRYMRTPAGAPVIDIPAPTMADFWSMAEGFAQHIWPSPLPVFCIVSESVEIFDGIYNQQNPSTNTPVSQGTTGSIDDILTRLRVAEGLPSDVIYCGFYPNYPEPSLPSGGYGGGGKFVTPSVIPGLMAHELGHAMGSMHTFDDPNYPHYGSLPSGTIGELGFDVLKPLAVEPGSTPPGIVPQRTHLDIMNYGAPRWISPYTYLNLFQAVGAPKGHDPCRITLPPVKVFYPEVYKVFICHYVVGLPDESVIGKICGPKIKVQFPPLLKREGIKYPIRARLLDAQEATIFEDIFEITPLVEDLVDPASISDAHIAPQRYQFAISVPDLDGAKRLIVTYEDQVIEDIELSAAPVAFDARAYLLDDAIPTVRVEWSLSPEEADVPVFIRASSDNGLSWTALNTPIGATQLDFDPASLPPGDGCMVEVLAGTQLRTTSWRSDYISVPTGRDELLVLRPWGETTVAYGEDIILSAVTTYGSGYEEIIWSSDRDGDLGKGGYQLVRLSPGKHLLSIRRGLNGKQVSSAVVEVNS